MNLQALKCQLVSMRAAIDAALAVLSEDEPPEPQECRHPEEARIDKSTMGHPDAWQCGICGYEHEGGDG